VCEKEISMGNTARNNTDVIHQSFSNIIINPGQCENCPHFEILPDNASNKYHCPIKNGDIVCDVQKRVGEATNDVEQGKYYTFEKVAQEGEWYRLFFNPPWA
jgi:hypothetical protein